MATTSERAHKHYIMVSGGKETDVSSPPTRDIALRMTDNADLSPGTPVVHYRDSESGRRSWSSEGAPLPIRMEWTKQYTDQADDSNVGLLGVFAASGEAAGGVARIGATSVYIQDVEGPAGVAGAASNIKGFALEDVGSPGAEDDALNRLVHNVFPESVEISGSSGGPIMISSPLRGGGLTAAIGGAPTTPAYFRNRIFRFSDMALISNLTTGNAAINVTGFTTAPTSAGFLADTQLVVAGAVDLTPMCKAIKLTIDNPVNLNDSYQPGNYDANYYGVVPPLGFVRAGHSVQIEARFLLGETNTKLFYAEWKAKTQRGIELWLKHPQAIESGAYVGCRMSLPIADMIAYVPSPDGLGPKYVTCTWRAVDDGTNRSWRYIAAGTYTTAMTA